MVLGRNVTAVEVGGGGEWISKVSKFTLKGVDDQNPPLITGLLFILHREQRTLRAGPQAGLQPVRSAPRGRRALLGSFSRNTPPALPSISGWGFLPRSEPGAPPFSPPPTARRRAAGPGPAGPEDFPPQGLRAGPRRDVTAPGQ